MLILHSFLYWQDILEYELLLSPLFGGGGDALLVKVEELLLINWVCRNLYPHCLIICLRKLSHVVISFDALYLRWTLDWCDGLLAIRILLVNIFEFLRKSWSCVRQLLILLLWSLTLLRVSTLMYLR
jgi:hypothetical protein